MSADLLRRAAKTLRNRVHMLPGTLLGTWFTRSSGVIADDGTDVGTLVVEPYNPEADGPVMAFIALMHPPVALALADALDSWAEVVDGVDKMLGHIPDDAYPDEFALARAILREQP